MAAIIVCAKGVLSVENVGHSCFQWILTRYGVIIKNPVGVVATL